MVNIERGGYERKITEILEGEKCTRNKLIFETW